MIGTLGRHHIDGKVEWIISFIHLVLLVGLENENLMRLNGLGVVFVAKIMGYKGLVEKFFV